MSEKIAKLQKTSIQARPPVRRKPSRGRKWILAIGFIVALLSGAASIYAYTIEQNSDQVTGQYTISPTKYELEVDPGDEVTRDIIVANGTGQTLTIEFTTEDFEGSSDPSQATVFLGDEDGRWGARHWIEPEITSIVLQHGETLTMKARISIPSDAEPGGHYASLFASTTIDSENEEGPPLNITSRPGCLFLINVSGEVAEEGTLNVPEVPGFSEYGPVRIGLVFNNQGNVHSKPSGRVLITNFLGQTVAEIPVKEWVVLPEASRRMVVEWDTRYQFGRYTARAEISYGPENVQLVTSRSFWIVPWKIVLIAAAGLVLLITLVSMLVRRRRTGHAEPREGVERPRELVQAPAEEAAGPRPGEHVVLKELFPSIDDARVIDLSDPETQRLVRELIADQLDLARAYIAQGQAEAASRELREARTAAQRMGLLFEVGVIDDMLRDL